MITDSVVMVKINDEIKNMSISELKTYMDNQRESDFSPMIFAMPYKQEGRVKDFTNIKYINEKDTKHVNLYKVEIEKPNGARSTFISDKDTMIMAHSVFKFFKINEFERVEYDDVSDTRNKIKNMTYFDDITGMKCKVCSVTPIPNEEKPSKMYYLKTRANNVFCNGVLIK